VEGSLYPTNPDQYLIRAVALFNEEVDLIQERLLRFLSRIVAAI